MVHLQSLSIEFADGRFPAECSVKMLLQFLLSMKPLAKITFNKNTETSPCLQLHIPVMHNNYY